LPLKRKKRFAPGRSSSRNCGGEYREVYSSALFSAAAFGYTPGMRVLGVDCGSECTGYGVVEGQGSALVFLAAGGIRLSPRQPLERRLKTVFDELSRLIAEHRPEAVAIEDVFYSVNAKSALKLGHVRGVAMMAAAQHSLPVAAYAPLAIKSSVVGYGRAEKAQVQAMVARLLRLDEPPEPADAADALAIAICHLHTVATLERQGVARR
jgi:crossover junction endodeoxyribonuclease RuvC